MYKYECACVHGFLHAVDKMIRKGLTKKKIFLSKDLKEVKEGSIGFLGWRILSRRSSKCKGPEMGLCLACLRNSDEASIPKEEEIRGE